MPSGQHGKECSVKYLTVLSQTRYWLVRLVNLSTLYICNFLHSYSKSRIYNFNCCLWVSVNNKWNSNSVLCEINTCIIMNYYFVQQLFTWIICTNLTEEQLSMYNTRGTCTVYTFPKTCKFIVNEIWILFQVPGVDIAVTPIVMINWQRLQ